MRYTHSIRYINHIYLVALLPPTTARTSSAVLPVPSLSPRAVSQITRPSSRTAAHPRRRCQRYDQGVACGQPQETADRAPRDEHASPLARLLVAHAGDLPISVGGGPLNL